MKKTLILPFFLFAFIAAAADSNEYIIVENCRVDKNIEVQEHKMELLNAGVRVKQRGVWPLTMDFNVYVAALYASDKSAFNKDTTGLNALNSLLSMPAFAINLQLLRDVDSATMVGAFQEALKANGIGQISSAITELMKLLRRDETLNIGDSVRITLVNGTGTSTIIVEQNDQQTVTIIGDQNDPKNIMSIWLGETEEEHLKTLKTKLISGK